MYFIIRYPYMNISIFLCLTFPSLNKPFLHSEVEFFGKVSFCLKALN